MHFSDAIDIAAPPNRIWQVFSDVDRWHEWAPTFNSIRRLGGKPFAVGMRALIRQPGLPPALWKVTAIEPGVGFTWVSSAPGVRVVASHRIEAIVGGSRATMAVELQGLFGGALAWLTKDLTVRYLALETAGLKQRSEDPGYTHGGLLA